MIYSVGLKYQLKFSADLSSTIGAFAEDVKVLSKRVHFVLKSLEVLYKTSLRVFG